MQKDVRWHQRLQNFEAALAELTLDISITEKRALSRTEEKGLIQSFEFTYEMAWNTIKDFFENQNETNIYGSRDAIRLAFKRGLIKNGQVWMDMINSRNKTIHTYNKEMADQIASEIIRYYYSEFVTLYNKLNQLKNTQS